MTQVIEFYNRSVAELPDHNKLKGLKLPGTSVVYDGKGELRFGENATWRTSPIIKGEKHR